MRVSTYFRDKHKTIQSKYHQVAKQFESKYELFHNKLTSRFHRESIEVEVVRSKVNSLIAKSTVSIDEKIKTKKFIPILSTTSTRKVDNFCQENIDWTRGRFSGKTIQIIVREGKIVEKVFLTPKGNRISVQRSELGLWFEKISLLKRKLRLFAITRD